MGLTYIDQI